MGSDELWERFTFVMGTARLKVRGLSAPCSAGTAVATLHPFPLLKGSQAEGGCSALCLATGVVSAHVAEAMGTDRGVFHVKMQKDL